ncbi:MAG: family N-acetyltransferase [Bacteroidetes bacterium]|jgi:N-acetylglutamate synthase-like GNAT family acetyltransferase|nr:family N-acetyltransferase [Bacteroidota bacterium]
MFIVSEPRTAAEFDAYYALRYEILRKPWNQPRGSEKDGEEETSVHAFIQHNDEVLAVCRLQMNDADTAQLRFMAVAENQQGKGLGKLIIARMEEKAKEKNATTIILQARENAVEFYKACGYEVLEKSHLLWGQIQHYLMRKKL